MTFTSEEGKLRCKRYLNKDEKKYYTPLKFHGSDLSSKDAPEPSDIIWENLKNSRSQILKKEVISCLIITFFLLLTLFLFTYLKGFAAVNEFRYPSATNCRQVSSLYGTINPETNKLEISDEQKKVFLRAATIDKHKAYLEGGSGDYNCYCKKYQNIGDILKNGDKDICAQKFYDGIWGRFLS